MIKNILVPIAFSKYSEGIIRFAADIGAHHGAKLLITNVVNQRDLEAVERIAGYGYKVDTDHYMSTVQQERIAELEKLLANLNLQEDDYDFVFLAGDPANEMLKLCLTRDIDLVVMGTRTNEIRHLFTGSVAEKMFRRSYVSVLFYRGDDVAEDLRKKAKKEIDK